VGNAEPLTRKELVELVTEYLEDALPLSERAERELLQAFRGWRRGD
jgi:hypothetical protein